MVARNLNFPNKYFIETGCQRGDGLEKARATGNYKQLFSIEIDHNSVETCRKRFQAFSNVEILEGDSSRLLPELLKRIDAPATFWLDGHTDTHSPIFSELESIRNHSIKTHTILIDDVSSFGTVATEYILIDDLILRLRKINSKYQISFIDGYEVANDVLLATI